MAERGLLTCTSCRVDVSVPEGVRDPRCPRCRGPLEEATLPEGNAPDRTIIAWRPPSEADTNKRVAPSPASGGGGTFPSPIFDSESASPSSPLLAPPESVTGSYRPQGFGPEIPDGIPVPKPPLAVGATFGPYVLEGVLGKGGMGIVYRARQPALGRSVALKVLTTAHADDEDRERFLREARAAARLAHPNIVPVHEVGSVEGRDYFTMDLVEGTNLHEAARRRRLTPEQSYAIVRKVAMAVDYAHEQGIVHRDLKPGNILLDKEDEPRVTDFGLAKDYQQAGMTITVSGVALGSPPYMPPEQARGDMKDVDAVSDVYALGAVLYECLTGEPPFTGQTLYEIVAKVQNEDPVSPRKKNPDCSIDGETIVLRCLEKEKWRRYPSAAALARDLDRLLKGEPIHALRSGLTTRIGKRIERHRRQIVSVLFALAVIAALGAFAFAVATNPGRVDNSQGQIPPEPDEPGPLEVAARSIERGEGASALSALLGFYAGVPERVATWGEVLERVSHLSPETSALVTRVLEARAFVAGIPARASKQGWEKRGEVVLALAEEKLSGESLREAVRALLAPHAEPGFDPNALRSIPERASEVVLAIRGAQTTEDADSRAAFTELLAGEPSPLDPALAELAAKSLAKRLRGTRELGIAALASLDAPRARELSRAIGSSVPLPVRDLETGALRGGAFAFPHVSLPHAVDGKIVDDAGLLGPAIADEKLLALAYPTAALRGLDPGTVIVGWLRFLYLLDGEGRVLARQRLPGRARRIARAADGALVVECERLDPSERDRWADPLARAEPHALVRVRSVEVDRGLLEDEHGRRVTPLDLDVLSTFATPWEMRAVARRLVGEHATVEQVDAALRRDPTNPWLVAIRAGARKRAGDARAVEDARAALASRHLTPAERVALACALDEDGFESEAEEAWNASLQELLREHAFFPHLAGYAAGDPGLELASAADAREARDPARATALRLWACAFAPVLRPRFPPRVAERVASVPAPRTVTRVRRGLGGLDGLSYHRLKLAFRFQQFLLAATTLALLTFLRCRRQQVRDLTRIGATTAWQRLLLYVRTPGIRVSFAWPNYVGLGDKVAFVILYVVFLGAFALQDAGLEALTRIHRTPPALSAGLPAHATARKRLEEVARGTYLHVLAKALAREPGWERDAEALRADGDARATMLLAFSRTGNERVTLLREAANARVPEAVALAGEQPGDATTALDLRVQVLGRDAEILPAPTVDERDRAIFGSTRWWTGVGGVFLRNLLQPMEVDASAKAFEQSCPEMVKEGAGRDALRSLHELRNRFFFLIPMTIVLCVASVLIPTKRPFAPGPEDLEPPGPVRLLAIAFPGIPQFSRGRPVRGVLLVMPFAHLAHVLYQELVLQRELVPTIFSESPEAVARLVAERPSSLGLVRAEHYFWLVVALGCVYVVHWVDIYLARRRTRLLLARSTRGKK